MWGTASVKHICRRARRLGYRHLALTDTDNLYGLWPFLRACEQEGLTPLVGAELTDPALPRRAVCLVEDDAGYRNLCRLITRRHTQEGFDLATAVAEHADGLVVLTGNPDQLETWHTSGVTVAAALPRRPVAARSRLRQTADRLGVPLVATPGSFFLQPEEQRVHRVLRAIASNTCLSRLEAHETAGPDAWLGSPGEYARRFAVCPQAVTTTGVLAERLRFHGPRFGVVMPPPVKDTQGDADRRLRKAAYRGAHRRYGSELSEAVVERLERELRLIQDMGFAGYFLIVREIITHSPRICGRGSGAASLVAYCLGITNVCPIKHKLYFERFLNPGRKDPPDIDVDFAWDERDHVLATVLDQYREHAAMVCNHVRFQPRMAVREVARVFGLTDAEIGQVSKRLPSVWRTPEAGADLFEALMRRPQSRRLGFPAPWPDILDLACRIIGTPRYLSVHPGGVVITPRPIDEYVPVERAAKGVPIIQWEKDAAEEAGLVKIDLLGNRSLGVIRDAVSNIRANGDILDDSRWEPEDDLATQETVAQGRTMGCFYIESPAMRMLQQKTRVGDFEHLVIHSSIIRPAANEFIREYIRRLHGGPWQAVHPCMAEVLDETFGIMVYQEDVSRVAMALAGFSHAEADGLRKVMAKKDRVYQLRDFRERFFDGARARGVGREQMKAVWEMMMSFSGYSFCKPHSASYARVSFQAAYLKVHHPAEFMAAVISNGGGFYSTSAYVSEARRMGLKILPPDINCSDIPWTGKNGTVRVGLLSVKGLAAATRERIIVHRRRRPFDSLGDFLKRVRPAENEARALIHSGTMDRFSHKHHRAVLIWQLRDWLTSEARQLPLPAPSLFAAPSAAGGRRLPALPPAAEQKRLRQELAVLGFLCDRHPMQLFQSGLRNLKTVRSEDLPKHLGRQVQFAGWLITGKVVTTRHGEPMEFLTFEDDSGTVEATFFPETYRRFCHMMDAKQPYLLKGTVERDWGAFSLTVNAVERIGV
jgi:DNA polymerase-3 subunit alpha/error-prone DNA polymerase